MAAAPAVNPDLALEREKATFDVDQLTYFLYGGSANTSRKRYIQNAVIHEVDKHKFRPLAGLSHEDQYEQALQRSALALRLEDNLAPKNLTETYYLREAVCPQSPLPHNLHVSMFMDVLSRQASEEQQQQWLPLARSFRMIGTYAQTEMGHGTFLRGLETTATYDPQTQEFVLHSPTISSMKYWPGGLGRTCNCCILMAHLITKGVNHGMHPFLLQLRDFDTHQPLPGISLGDIGAKFGYNSIDNGFLLLDHVRIPRTNMLMRYSQVLEDGTYVKPENTRLTYSSMTLIRSNIVGSSSRSLAMAVTIAVRYSAVRRQSEIEPGKGEVQVLDFQTQQMKLLPQVAAAYALTCVSRNMQQFYQSTVSSMEKGILDELPQLHALSSGLKALSSWEAQAGVEQCRMACGGHGFSHASGIPKIYAVVSPTVTLEGENTVLMLQVARYLMKWCGAVKQGEGLPSLMSYLGQRPAVCSSLDTALHLSDLVDLYQHTAARLTHAVSKKLDRAASKGQKGSVAWNSNSVELIAAATAHSKYYVVKSMADMVCSLMGQLREVMGKLCQLYAVCGILESLGHFLEDGYLNSTQSAMLRDRLCDLLADLRPNAVALVDAFDFPDAILDSALGRWDGNVYDALYDWSLNSTMNEKQVVDAYYKYQRPFMEAEWAKNPKVKATARL